MESMQHLTHLQRDGDLCAHKRRDAPERAVHRDGRGRPAGVRVDDVRQCARVYAPEGTVVVVIGSTGGGGRTTYTTKKLLRKSMTHTAETCTRSSQTHP